MLRQTFILFVSLIFFVSCRESKKVEFSNQQIQETVTAMTDIMVHDITNPPLAARFFSYSLLSGYEIISKHDSTMPSMKGKVNEYPDIKHSLPTEAYDFRLSALLAMMETSKKMQPSGSRMADWQKRFVDSCLKEGIEEEVMNASLVYAQSISKQLLDYAKSDGYNKISNLPRYSPSKDPGSWYPTPPGFIAAVEPYFNKVRPFTLDSCTQFKPPHPAEYSKDTAQEFYKLVSAVYQESKMANQTNQEIAAFWDCNPFNLNDKGHLQFAYKKISPGAHWLGITGIACEDAKKSFNESFRIHTIVAMGLMDGFMACWDEKFRSNRIRPETAIRQMIDPTWTPFLQTPPFPEYLSGHSTISFTSATILTSFFGEGFKYTDRVEVPYGLPERTFNSFLDAAEEAGLSRFYGGIHFMDAIVNGSIQGKEVGSWVIKRMNNDSK
ncbi:MAG: vanadium-dependent haloperoxidase [Flavitalea sp.]